MRYIFALALLALAIISTTAAPRTQRGDSELRDQVIKNTVRLDSLEEALHILQRGGSTEAHQLAVAVGRIEAESARQKEEILYLRNVLVGAIIFMITQTIAVLSFGLKTWFGWMTAGKIRTRS